MCTNETKQEALFLRAMFELNRSATPLELANAMVAIARGIGWPAFLVRSPRSIDALLERALHFKHVSKTSANKWQFTELGRNRLNYVVERYVPSTSKHALSAQERLTAALA